MKKILSAVVSAAICLSAFSAVPAGAVQTKIDTSVVAAEKVTESGTCGTNTKWTLEGGKLTVYGSGATVSWIASDKVPWNKYRSQITSVVVEKGITSIGSYAFTGCSNLTSVTIENGVTEIQMSAFSLCTALTSIELPASLATLGREAFLKCSALQSVTFMNPKCKIVGGADTICNSSGSYSGSIIGYDGSSAKTYADKFGYNFRLLSDAPISTTTTTTTTTTTSTTTTKKPTTSTTTSTTTTKKPTTSTTTSTTTTKKPTTSTTTSITTTKKPTTSTTTSTTTTKKPTTSTTTSTTTTKKPTTSTTTFVSTTTTLFITTTTLPVSTSVSSRFFGELFMNGPTKTVYTVGEKVDYSGAKFHYYVEYEAGQVSARGGNFRDFSEISDGIYTEEYILTPVIDVSETFVVTIDRSKVDTSKAGVYKVTAKITNKDGSKLYDSTDFEITVNAKTSDDYELGDVNNDKHIDSVDASMVLAEYARLSSNQNANFDSKQTKAADVNHDDHTDSNDASLILSYYAYSATLQDGEAKKSLSEFLGK